MCSNPICGIKNKAPYYVFLKRDLYVAPPHLFFVSAPRLQPLRVLARPQGFHVLPPSGHKEECSTSMGRAGGAARVRPDRFASSWMGFFFMLADQWRRQVLGSQAPVVLLQQQYG